MIALQKRMSLGWVVFLIGVAATVVATLSTGRVALFPLGVAASAVAAAVARRYGRRASTADPLGPGYGDRGD
jgi:hypothetical protein